MNTLLRRLAWIASAMTALTVSVAATAQAAHPPEGGPGSMGRHMGGPMGGPMGAHRMHRPATAAEVSARLDQQKAALALSAAQEPAWQNFATVVRRHAEARDAEHLKMLTEHDAHLHAEMDALKSGAAQPAPGAASATPNLSPADRAERHAAMMKLHETQRAERDEALKGLLAVLTPAQKTQAENLLRRPRMGHRMMQGMLGAGPDGKVPAEHAHS